MLVVQYMYLRKWLLQCNKRAPPIDCAAFKVAGRNVQGPAEVPRLSLAVSGFSVHSIFARIVYWQPSPSQQFQL